ncbi:MAG: V-type ATP synthase subunit D [Synergistaceae bacterium]|nr:V-type ATP synthase subunit D [Synergistaceae bacterium]MBQ6738899.1 V-type ATP synthase subunit D [Synergistaceae bacterium]MBQ7067627.1 V-type ATP synthase subunit D [Synergistaceae bacterium]MBR0076361.1 V-type ATP synthase subunit D [Synergistaceae bacterium]MBR0079258.1 V-type ATP synthase subunit D [Synergistaceae bacterium]
MARINVNPNRMELSKLKRRLAVAKRGHKLLKDKQDALIKAFLEKARAGKELRESVEKELAECYGTFVLSRAQTTPEILEQALIFPGAKSTLTVKWHNVMSVMVPEYDVKQEGNPVNYGFVNVPLLLDEALEQFSKLILRLLQLAAEEKAIRLMAGEIERTRRRVNALEYVMIPNLAETIRYISMKLDEQERSTLSRLMKIKEIVSA